LRRREILSHLFLQASSASSASSDLLPIIGVGDALGSCWDRGEGGGRPGLLGLSGRNGRGLFGGSSGVGTGLFGGSGGVETHLKDL